MCLGCLNFLRLIAAFRGLRVPLLKSARLIKLRGKTRAIQLNAVQEMQGTSRILNTPSTQSNGSPNQVQEASQLKLFIDTCNISQSLFRTPAKQQLPKSSRAPKGTLHQLTANFLGLMMEKPNNINLDQLSLKLSCQKRRIYDLMNIFQGLGLLAKSKREGYSWTGFQSFSDQPVSDPGQGKSLSELTRQVKYSVNKFKLSFQKASQSVLEKYESDPTLKRRIYDIGIVLKCLRMFLNGNNSKESEQQIEISAQSLLQMSARQLGQLLFAMIRRPGAQTLVESIVATSRLGAQ